MYRHTRYHIHKNLYLDCLCVCSYRESAKGKYKIHKYRNKRIKSRTSSAYYEQYFQILSAYTHTSVCQCVWNIDANRSHILESVRPLTQKTKFPHTNTYRHTVSHIDRNLQYTRGVYLLCLTASTEIRALSAMLRLVKAAVL